VAAMRQLLGAAALVLGMLGGAQAAERVDLELVLLADASRSIDDVENMLQRQGYATAITDPEVLSAIAQGYRQRIAVTYVEWGDESEQKVIVPWTVIDGRDSALAFAQALLERPRRAFGMNAIGSALDAAHALIETNNIEGDRKVIDFSGDSANSFSGVSVEAARAAAIAGGVTINGLAILCRGDCTGRPVSYDLEAAFASDIIGGYGSFVITADQNRKFAEAVRKKLLLEIAALQPARAD